MDPIQRAAVERRAGYRCEYCLLPVELSRLHFHIDHIRAVQHGGLTGLENLALGCLHCNAHKGPNVAGIDPDTGQLTRRFNPRADRWDDHFRWDGPRILGLTAIGRTTVAVLAMNDRAEVTRRAVWIAAGRFRPQP
jgi:hypothetical protein